MFHRGKSKMAGDFYNQKETDKINWVTLSAFSSFPKALCHENHGGHQALARFFEVLG